MKTSDNWCGFLTLGARQKVVLLLIFAGGAVFCHGCTVHSPTPPSEPSAKAQPQVAGLQARLAVPFELKDQNGQPRALSDFKGSVVLLHFWASWCPPCRPELPKIIALAREYEKKSLSVLAVSEDDRLEDAVKLLGAKMPRNFVLLWDVEHKVTDQYGAYMYPETYLINARGELVTKWAGAQEWGSPEIRGVIERAF